MSDENTSVNEVFSGSASSPAPVEEGGSTPESSPQPSRPQYTPFQRVLALLGAIFVIIVTLMYTYSIATGDLFFR